jgi:hypothetical protein
MKMNYSSLRPMSAVSGLVASFLFSGPLQCEQPTLIWLKGVVNQPLPPFSPAPNSIVVVFDGSLRETIARDVSDAHGQFKFHVARGQKVVVIASWRREESMPGTLRVSVTSDPTDVKIQLQPPKSAPEETWFNAGALSAKTGAESTNLVANVLHSKDLPAVSMFQFVKGAKSASKYSFQGIDGLEIFKADDSKSVASGLKEVQSEWKTSKSVPSYDALLAKTDGKLTHTQYVQILGFSAPTDSATKSIWQSAVQQSVGDDGKNEVNAFSQKMEAYVFKSQDAERSVSK